MKKWIKNKRDYQILKCPILIIEWVKKIFKILIKKA